MERDDLVPLPAQRLLLRRDRRQIAPQRLRASSVPARPDEHGGLVEEGDESIGVAGVDSRLESAQNEVCVGERIAHSYLPERSISSMR